MNNIENNNNNNNNSNLNMTDAGMVIVYMEAQFIERNGNLKKSLNSIVDKIDAASSKTHDYLAQNVGGETSLSSGNASVKPSNILEQNSTGFGINSMDSRLMRSIKSDINAMHSSDAEQFEDIASKIDETFGQNALV
ncbi:hypothetical protein [Parasitella parasitica]|uniref:Uncharacterized protein n=1 Tax=Parasitella parasitica TaxID=35722 RepID=A0A0B7MTL3_9FUNG|nr:hypothetical protein [Parasitella parasitica]